MAEYHNQSKLRFWCQMVLPLVYDDSLSYMELLNKVVSYLNNCIQDVGNCETNIESLLEAFVNLQDYVNEIAEDAESIIEQKIDEMIESGEFGEILADALATVVAEEYDPTESYVPLNYAIKDGQLYCCIANTTGEWDSTKWRETTVGDELNTLMRRVYNLNAGQVSYSGNATYDSGTVGKELKDLHGAIEIAIEENNTQITIPSGNTAQTDIVTGFTLKKGTYIAEITQENSMATNQRNTFWYNDSGRVYESTATNRHLNADTYRWIFTIDHDLNNTSIGIWLNGNDVNVSFSNFKLYALPQEAYDNLNGAITSLQTDGFNFQNELSGSIDLNSYYSNGWYEIGYSATVSNAPEPTGTVGQRQFYIFGESKPTANKYRHMFYWNRKTGVFASRLFTAGAWQPWYAQYSPINNTANYTKTFSPTGIAAAPSYNKGKRIKICQYNVANYNNDTSVYMPDNKVLNFRRFLAQEKFDFVLTEEDREYIDANNTNSSLQYLYYPMLNEYYCLGRFHQTIHCNQLRDSSFAAYKFKMPNSNSDSRRIQVMLTNIAGKKVLLMVAHCSWRDFDADDPTSAANIAGRLAQYQAIYNWENGTSTLHRVDTDAEVTCPSHDIAIICMDANCVTNTDKNNLLNLFNANGWQAGNGGRFGWFDSDLWNGDTSGMVSLDFCAVKGDVIINDCRPMYEWLPLLYSDHVPVEFDITILNPEPDSYTPTYSEKVTAASSGSYDSVYVKDGIAYVKLTMTVAQQMTGGAPELVSGLPHPKKQFQFVGFNYKGNDVYDNIKIKFNTDGTVQSWYSPVLDVGDIFSIDTTYAVG